MLPRVLFILLLLAAVAAPASAAESVTLSFVPKPERSVDAVTENDTKLVANLTGDPELVERNRIRGLVFPYLIHTHQRNHRRTVTSKANSDGSIPLEIQFLEAESNSVDRDGKALAMRASLSDFVGVSIKALARPDGRVEFVSMDGGHLKPEVMAMLPKFLENVFGSMKSIEGAHIEVGGSINQKSFFDMPVPGFQPIRFAVDTKFTLQRIANGIALFSVNFTYIIDQVPTSMRVHASGGGTGAMEYDVSNNLMLNMTTTTSMEMTVNAGQAIVTSNAEMRQTTKQSLISK